MIRALVLALLPACSLYVGQDAHPSGNGSGGSSLPPADPHWIRTRAIAGEHQVAGVDSDGAGGLWIAYRDAPSDVWVTHLDASLVKVSEWHFTDDPTLVSGIAFAGDRVWVNYYGTQLRALDATTGETLTTIATDQGIVDISYGAGSLWLSNLWNQVETIDPQTGFVQARITTTAFDYSTQRGIAYVDGTLWLANWSGVDIDQVDTAGTLDDELWIDAGLVNGSQEGMQLAWTGSELLLAANNQIMWLARSD